MFSLRLANAFFWRMFVVRAVLGVVDVRVTRSFL